MCLPHYSQDSNFSCFWLRARVLCFSFCLSLLLFSYFILFVFVFQTFFPLVDYHGLSEEDHPIPVEFVGDHER